MSLYEENNVEYVESAKYSVTTWTDDYMCLDFLLSM